MSNDDEMPNNTVATGAVFALLHAAASAYPASISLSFPERGPSNQIMVTFGFMNSPYRLTVERVTDENLTRKEMTIDGTAGVGQHG